MTRSSPHQVGVIKLDSRVPLSSCNGSTPHSDQHARHSVACRRSAAVTSANKQLKQAIKFALACSLLSACGNSAPTATVEINKTISMSANGILKVSVPGQDPVDIGSTYQAETGKYDHEIDHMFHSVPVGVYVGTATFFGNQPGMPPLGEVVACWVTVSADPNGAVSCEVEWGEPNEFAGDNDNGATP